MESEADLAAMPTSPNPVPAVRAQRLLEAMHPVCSHDLPNQAVALQSLLQLFAWDEADKLSPQGREYFERLQSIAAKTSAFVQFLKEMARLQRHTPLGEKLALAQVVDEVRADAARMYPEHAWTWKIGAVAETLAGDRRLLQQGIVQLLRFAICSGIGPAPTVELKSARQPDHLSLSIAVRCAPEAMRAPSEAGLIEARLALTLAQEYLACVDIACRQVEGSAAGAMTFALMIR